MQRIQLGRIVATFPDGISRGNYERIGRLIRKCGPLATIPVATDHNELTTTLKRAEQGKGIISAKW